MIVKVAEVGEVVSKRQTRGRAKRDWNGWASRVTGVPAVLLIMAEELKAGVNIY